MNVWTRKKLMGLVVGGALLAGIASPFAALAAEPADAQSYGRMGDGAGMGMYQQQGMQGMHKMPGKPGMQQRHMDPDKMAQRMADTFGVSKDDILKYMNHGIHGRDLHHGVFLAKASGKSLTEVMQAKTLDNSWKDVADKLGVSREQAKAVRNELAAARLESKMKVDRQVSLPLLQQGYHGRDIVVANELSRLTGKAPADLLAMRKINNTWRDVAQSVGVSQEDFQKSMQELRHNIGAHHPGGPGFPGGQHGAPAPL